jgi:S-(hydroxymethyl)glutathione dehydrogenase/alcohol dehydrogenase
MTHFVNPKDGDDVVGALVELTRGGADYSFECIGNVEVMRQALECATRAGASRSSSVWPARAGDLHAPLPARHRPRVARVTAFGGARGRTDVPRIVDWYMDGRSTSTA